MAAIKAKCPKCGKPFGVLERQIGSSVHCPHCGQRMKISGPQKQEPAETREDAIAQMFAPAPGEGEQASKERQEQAGSPSRAALGAMEEAFGPPPKRRAKPEPRPVAMAQAAPAAGTTTRLAQNLGLDQQEQDHLLDNAPIHSRTVVWVWLSILAVVVVVLSIVLYMTIQKYKAEAGLYAMQQIKDGTTGAGTRVVRGKQGSQTVAPAPVEGIERLDPGYVMPQEKSPLVLRWPKDSYYVETPKPTDVWVIPVENVTGQIVRRTGVTITVLGADSKKTYGIGDMIFHDVHPGETVYGVFEHPYIGEPGGKRVGTEWLPFDTDKPVYKFDIHVRKLEFEGGGTKNGTVIFDITNLTEHDAPVVDVLLILHDKRSRPAGYAKAQVLKVEPGKTVEGRAPWKHAWGKPDYAGAHRAQIAEESGK